MNNEKIKKIFSKKLIDTLVEIIIHPVSVVPIKIPAILGNYFFNSSTIKKIRLLVKRRSYNLLYSL